MSDFTTHTCVSVRCGTCKETYRGGDDDYGIQHFDNREAVAKDVTELGWKVDGDTVACHDCAVARACAENGHVWDPSWWPCGCGCHDRVLPGIPAHIQPMECRHCARCSEGEERVMSHDSEEKK